LENKHLMYIDSIRRGHRGAPVSLQIALTDHCFNQCPMCGHWRRSHLATLDMEVLLDYLGKLEPKGLESCCYSGGDPFTRGDLSQLMSWHIGNQVLFSFITAGYSNDTLDLGLLRHAKWVRVSMDSVVPETYAKIRGGTISLNDVVKSIDRMVAAEVNVQFNLTISNKNVRELGKIFDFAIDHGISEVTTKLVRHTPGMALSPAELALAQEICEDYRKKFFDHDIPAFLACTPYEVQPIDQCWASLYQGFISADGRIYPCCIGAGDTEASSLLPSLGNIYEDPFDVWKRVSAFGVMASGVPKVCQDQCLERLNIINTSVEGFITKQNFF
jgi:MoaA/NifB/PqqE/SkfB family radical SAM enzyme